MTMTTNTPTRRFRSVSMGLMDLLYEFGPATTTELMDAMTAPSTMGPVGPPENIVAATLRHLASCGMVEQVESAESAEETWRLR